MSDPSSSHPAPGTRILNFIEHLIEEDNRSGKWGTWADGRPKVHTRFPPEPNGYLHIGHAKSICLNSGLAREYGGKFNLRFDDTNPSKEEQEYVDAIKRDVKWLGADYENGPIAGGVYWASDYFERMCGWAEELIKKGKAYVCDLSAEEVSRNRGNTTQPAKSPWRDRPIAESLELFRRMKAGEFPNGAKTLRAKIDLASPNFVMRDPVMYRIVHESHHNTGNRWCIYPMYDWAHCLEDSIEGITHSICTLEFRNNRPLYDWFIDSINEGRGEREGESPWGVRIHHPQQIEFARLNLTYTVMSKRFLLSLVESGRVNGWDDPRMPTIAGLRRRGFPSEAIRAFAHDIGVTTQESVIDVARLENAVRDHLNKIAPRAMSVVRPLKVVIDNWPEGQIDDLDFVVNPEDPAAGTRRVRFGKVIYIEQDDFMESPPKKFFRLAIGQEVRLRWAYFIRATSVVKDSSGAIVEVHATYDPTTRGGDAADGRKVKGTIHWIEAGAAVRAEVRLVDRLFNAEEPGKRTGNMLDDLNPRSIEVVEGLIEPAVATAAAGQTFQFERLGYFTADRDSTPGRPVFNRTVPLKDTWSKAQGG